jgi:hypothetical protein
LLARNATNIVDAIPATRIDAPAIEATSSTSVKAPRDEGCRLIER